MAREMGGFISISEKSFKKKKKRKKVLIGSKIRGLPFISTNIFVTKRIIKFLKLGLIICLVKKNQELSYILASPL